MTQSQALKILLSGQNVFLTGSAGTGKTFLLNKFITKLKKQKKNVAITASTGIAATHLGGRTVHSWSGMGIERAMTDKMIIKSLRRGDLREKIRSTEILIIDEISMIDSARFNLIDRICKAVKDPFQPFGGIQIVVSGDFFQLPPVDPENLSEPVFDSYSWHDAGMRVCYLKQQFRQDDSEFVKILNKIRRNKAGQAELDLLKTRLYQPVDKFDKPTKLYTHNCDVDIVNNLELSAIEAEEFRYDMTGKGPEDLVNSLKKGCLAPEILKLKIDAMVMFIRNNFDSGYVNGTLGRVIDFDEKGFPLIKLPNDKVVVATPTIWVIENNDEIIAHINQLPLRLAWAITVHKSQGMSLDAAEIDLSKSFERGMGYVALSRVRTLSGIRLLGINNLSVRVDDRIIEKDKEFLKLSKSGK
jgi:ATP-dependent exoDNAse (exonuclease V) alpha subunit